MRITVIKGGMLDTVQDAGRYGYQQYGINPCGAMDVYAMQVANILANNARDTPVIELHFPASSILFRESALIAMAGADFGAVINNEPIPIRHPVQVRKRDLLEFRKPNGGARCYLAIHGGIDANKWLNSYSTQLKARIGGHGGRALKKEDLIQSATDYPLVSEHRVFPWKAEARLDIPEGESMRILPGPEWDWLSATEQFAFLESTFIVDQHSDRMAYRLKGNSITMAGNQEMVSSAVTFGTIQLLPDGTPLVLMADHQTTGGYPRIAQLVSADHGRMAQLNAGEELHFEMIEMAEAERLYLSQQHDLQQLQNACTFRMEEFLKANGRP
jgi:antagonist of KipI